MYGLGAIPLKKISFGAEAPLTLGKISTGDASAETRSERNAVVVITRYSLFFWPDAQRTAMCAEARELGRVNK